jgi:ubiquitin-protein ligase
MSNHIRNIGIQRIAIDIQKLMELYPCIEVQAIYKSNETIVSFHMVKDFAKSLIEIHVNNQKYPFLPPITLINHKPYYEYITPHSKRIQNIIKTKYKCFSTILTFNHWLPTYQLHHILREIKEISDKKRNIQRILLIEDIGKKYHLPKVLETTILEYM